jgi:V/A-type H+/Na+-transporting ATPase subunit I
VLVAMTPVQIMASRAHLPAVIAELHRRGVVQLTNAARPSLGMAPVSLGNQAARRRDELRTEASDLTSLLGLAETAASTQSGQDRLRPVHLTVPPERLGRLAAGLSRVLDRIEWLQAEHATARRYHDALAALIPLEPELALFDEADLTRLGLATVVLVLDAPHAGVLDALRSALQAAAGDCFHLAGVRTDEQTVGCVLVLPHALSAEVRALLGREHIRHVPLPHEYERLSLAHALAEISRRLADLPPELAKTWSALAEITTELAPGWRVRQSAVHDELDRLEAVALAGRTEHTASLAGWLPGHSVEALHTALAQIGREVTVAGLDPGDAGEPPALLDNPPPIRPYERLVGFFALPRGGSLDPSTLIAAVLPAMFGIMVGDLAYGLVFAGIGAVLRHRAPATRPVLRDAGRILLVSGAWSGLFGLLFGEALGSLGHKLGLPALWFYRGGPEALETLLLLAVGIGVTHVLLGLLLGIRQAQRLRQPRTLIERAGAFFLLCGLAAIAAVAMDLLPSQVRTPAIAVVAVTFVMAAATRGAIGLLTGPLELLGIIGHVLSYLRLAAVGLASVYLAAIANELAVSVPLLLGVFIAALLHLLNLALAAFTPMVQALRLHYVEFFSAFYEGGGHSYRPFGRRPEPASE